jgi:hypothetical protein
LTRLPSSATLTPDGVFHRVREPGQTQQRAGRRSDVTEMNTAPPQSWRVAGSYFEACNCDAVCPCRTLGERPGGRSTHGFCQFALSWWVKHGWADRISLDDCKVVLAGWYDDDEPGSPWRVILYIDEVASPAQRDALADIFLGRAGGTTVTNFAAAIRTVHAVRRAQIDLSHEPRRWWIRADKFVTVTATEPFETHVPVACGIPGLDRPGTEVRSDTLVVQDRPLDWRLHERCGFATDFDYASS